MLGRTKHNPTQTNNTTLREHVPYTKGQDLSTRDFTRNPQQVTQTTGNTGMGCDYSSHKLNIYHKKKMVQLPCMETVTVIMNLNFQIMSSVGWISSAKIMAIINPILRKFICPPMS